MLNKKCEGYLIILLCSCIWVGCQPSKNETTSTSAQLVELDSMWNLLSVSSLDKPKAAEERRREIATLLANTHSDSIFVVLSILDTSSSEDMLLNVLNILHENLKRYQDDSITDSVFKQILKLSCSERVTHEIGLHSFPLFKLNKKLSVNMLLDFMENGGKCGLKVALYYLPSLTGADKSLGFNVDADTATVRAGIEKWKKYIADLDGPANQ